MRDESKSGRATRKKNQKEIEAQRGDRVKGKEGGRLGCRDEGLAINGADGKTDPDWKGRW